MKRPQALHGWSVLTAMAPVGEGRIGGSPSQSTLPARCRFVQLIAWYSPRIGTPRENEEHITAIILNIQLQNEVTFTEKHSRRKFSSNRQNDRRLC